MRDVELAQMSAQVPVLLEAIKLASGLTFLGLYEALAPSMGVSPESTQAQLAALEGRRLQGGRGAPGASRHASPSR